MPHILQLAALQFSPGKGEYEANLSRLGDIFAQLDSLDPRPDVLHLPESALTGYFLEGGVREHARTAGALADDLQRMYLAAGAGSQPLEVAIGFYEQWNSILYNSALWVRLGGDAPLIRHVHRKNFLPTYGLFDEERFVERGHDIRAFDTPWGRFAMLVCEDAWHSLPGTLLALDGATVIFISAAAPARGVYPRDDAIPGPASVARWDRLVRDIAEEQGVFVSFANLVATEGGKSFPGGATIAGPAGEVRVRGPLWREALISIPLDLNDLSRARSEMPLLADLQTAIPHLLDNLEQIRAETPAPLEYDPAPAAKKSTRKPRAKSGGRAGGIEVLQVSARENGAPSPLSIDGALTEGWLTTFIRDELAQRNYEKGVVALSGGLDSAVTAFLAVRAMGADKIVGVRLPYRTSSPESLEHAQMVIDALGIEARTLDISASVDGYLASEPEADETRRGNVMARVRMIATFDLGARYKALPLGTGNKTERLLGYFTWHGDDAPPVNPLGDLYKTQVRQLARHLGVPAPILEKAPSADLVHGQTDEGDLGITYELADQILHWLLSGFSAEELTTRGFDAKEVDTVRRRLGSTHWKRRLPTVAMLTGTAIGESYLRPVDY
ncbi:MAG: NH(3)-dependent synthetase [Gemmatimonadetes bacterium]|nr:NH(3)-dependent synthetase [Gemmatimonadota bacterium]